MNLRSVPRLYRRTLTIYVCAIVVPAFALLWLGIQSFERQRQALASLQAEKVVTELDKRVREAARAVLENTGKAPPVRHRFTMRGGSVTEPALHAPVPLDTPPEFVAAETEELIENRPAAALDLYRKLLHSKPEGLALARMARCLMKLGRTEDARALWRKLAVEHPDARDLAYRPYGIVAAIAAGETTGLYERIAAGRWELAADQTDYFLSQLGPGQHTPYLDRFVFARKLNSAFRHEGRLEEDEVYKYNFEGHTIFYRQMSGRIVGFELDPGWAKALNDRITDELGFNSRAGGASLYAASLTLVIAVLTAGVFLLLRDLSREARTSQLRSEFVSGVSHELKTPVTVIRLYAETLLHGARFDDTQRREFYRIITRESGRLASLIDRVLTFSRIERGAESYRLEPSDPAPLILRTLDEYREYLDQAGFKLQQTVPESAPEIRLDSTAVSQALINLLDNAVKYSGESRDVNVRLSSDDGSVVIEVEDQGIGIDGAEQQRIFERFYRARNDSGKGGYGLGLYLVRRTMDAHGGRAEVESEPGRGSRFRLIFPVAGA